MDEPKLGMEPFADPATRKTAGESKLDRVKEMSSRAKGEKAPTQTAVKEEMVVAASYLEGGSSGTSRKPLLETTEPAESEDGFRPVVRLTRATFIDVAKEDVKIDSSRVKGRLASRKQSEAGTQPE